MIPRSGADLVARWNEELRALGYHDPDMPIGSTGRPGPRVGELDRDLAADVVMARLGVKRSAWNLADVRGEVERWIATTGLVASAAVRLELAEDLTVRTTVACVPLLDRSNIPEHVRALTSPQVLAVEADLIARLAHRASLPVSRTTTPSHSLTDLLTTPAIGPGTAGLDTAQADAVAALAGDAALLVVEGAAGSGKTRTLAVASEVLAVQGHRLMVVTPTLKAARVVGRETGAEASSAAWLVHQHGWRWDADGRWTRHPVPVAGPDPSAVLHHGDLLVVDEAGMLDQDTALALLSVADETGTRVALLGDRHQLPPVGRGGVLDHALRWATDQQRLCLDVVHRFSDPDYAALTGAMRTGTLPDLVPEHFSTDSDPSPDPTPDVSCRDPGVTHGAVCSALWSRGDLRLYATEAERLDALADEAVAGLCPAGASVRQPVLVMADTRDQVTALNAAIRDRLVATGAVNDQQVVTTLAGERLGLGDRVATRRNARDLGVANRDTWRITGLADDGGLTITGRTGTRHLPAAYARDQVELAYATTVYGAQGETVATGHLVLGEHTTGAAAYVGMTRGRHRNTVHIVAETYTEARDQWVAAFLRDAADLGPARPTSSR